MRIGLCIVVLVAGAALGAAEPPKAGAKTNEGAAAQNVSVAQPPQQQASEYTSPCAKGQDRRQSDLCAQWKASDAADRAAIAAEESTKLNWWQLWVGLVGAAGLAAALFLTIWSNIIARNTAKRQLRAYIALTEFGLEWDKGKGEDGPNTTATVFGHWRNSGQTPADQMSERINWTLMDGPLPDDFDFPDLGVDPTLGQYVVGPSHTYISVSDRRLTLPEVVALERKLKRAFVWSWTNYRDIFGGLRRTEVAAEMVVTLLKSREHHFQFNLIGRHNAFDDDCLRKRGKN